MLAYLDHAASTPMCAEALDCMTDVLANVYGNPSGHHAEARRARDILEQAREEVAAWTGFEPGEIVFTSGGTEADNLAVLGAAASRPGPVVCSAVEHPAVLRASEHLGARIVPVAPNGVVDLDALASLLDPSVGLVSLMAANNEVGVVQPLAEAVSLVRELAPGAVVHTDAVHAAPWLDLAELSRDVDLVSLSAHKFQGPKGAGILAIRGSVEGIVPRGFGGSQERDLRPGTQDVAAIAGMAAALRATASRRASEAARVGALRDRLADGLRAALEGVVETGEGESGRSHKVPGSCHLCIEGVEAQELLVLLDQMGVAASVGSSCASGATQPSHVLAAMGVPPGLARGAVRFSLGHGSRSEEVDHALDVVPEAVGRLRGKRRSS